MSSLFITGYRYRLKPEEADYHDPFSRTFLAEGDSCMDASAWNLGSLLVFLVLRFNQNGETKLIIKISTSGYTLTHIVDMMSGDLVCWLDRQRYDGLVLSAGGRDFIGAARDVLSGQGLLRDMKSQPLPANCYDCVCPDALRQFKTYLNSNFAAIYQLVRSSECADSLIYLKCNDTPRARSAPAIPCLTGPWLYELHVKNSIDDSLWGDLIGGISGALREKSEGLKKDSVTGD